MFRSMLVVGGACVGLWGGNVWANSGSYYRCLSSAVSQFNSEAATRCMLQMCLEKEKNNVPATTECMARETEIMSRGLYEYVERVRKAGQ
jgi:hypothetical protein